jgi:hypothetical protein
MYRKAGRMSLFGVWLASFALLLQTVLPLVSRPASAEDAASPFASDLVLCTAHGLAKVSAADHDTQTDPADTTGTTLKCPLCQVWHSLGNALPASVASVLGPAYEAVPNEAAPARPAQSRFQRVPLQPRAPPQTA